jgi:hypothetical protein
MMIVALAILDNIPMIRLWGASFLKICHSVLKALSKMRTGRKIARMPVGLAELISSADSPSTPNYL